jgi:hypothetical protein
MTLSEELHPYPKPLLKITRRVITKTERLEIERTGKTENNSETKIERRDLLERGKMMKTLMMALSFRDLIRKDLTQRKQPLQRRQNLSERMLKPLHPLVLNSSPILR